jgi:hypothetical protein
VVPQGEVGASDGERLVAPGGEIPLARFWDRGLRLWAAAAVSGEVTFPAASSAAAAVGRRSSSAGINAEVFAVRPILLGLPGRVHVSQESRSEVADRGGAASAGPVTTYYEGVCLHARLAAATATGAASCPAVRLFRLADARDAACAEPQGDEDEDEDEDEDADECKRARRLVDKLKGTSTVAVSLSQGRCAALLFELPPEWLAEAGVDRPLGLLRVAQTVCDALLWGAAPAASTRSERVTFALPRAAVDSGFAPVPGLPGAWHRATLAINVEGLMARAYCGAHWSVAASPHGVGVRPDATWPARRLVPDSAQGGAGAPALPDDRIAFTRPFVCATIDSDARAVTTAFMVTSTAWVPAAAGAASAAAAATAAAAEGRATHQRLRSPTKRFDTGSRLFAGLPAAAHEQGRFSPRRPASAQLQRRALYDVPSDATTSEVIFLVRRALLETIARADGGGGGPALLAGLSGPRDLGQVFDGLCDLCSPRAGAAKPRGLGLGLALGPGRLAAAPATTPVSLSRAGLRAALLATLGLRMSWAQFDAFFLRVCGADEALTRSAFISAFDSPQAIAKSMKSTRRDRSDAGSTGSSGAHGAATDSTSPTASSATEGEWVHDTLCNIADAMLQRQLSPWDAFPAGEHTSQSAFARFVAELGVRLTRTEASMLASMVMTTSTRTCNKSESGARAAPPPAHQNQYQRRLVSASRFAQLMAVVYREQLEDLSLLRLAEGPAPPRSRVAALDALTSATARSLRAVREREFAAHILSPHLVPELVLAAAATEAGSEGGDHLTHLLHVAPSGTTSRRPADEPGRTLSIIAELRCPWVHVPLRSVAAAPGVVPGPFAPLLERAGVPEAAKMTAVSLAAPLRHRLERLQRVILAMEKASGLSQGAQEDTHVHPHSHRHQQRQEGVATHHVRSPQTVLPVALLVHADARVEWLLDAVSTAPRTGGGVGEPAASISPVVPRSPGALASCTSRSAVGSPASPATDASRSPDSAPASPALPASQASQALSASPASPTSPTSQASQATPASPTSPTSQASQATPASPALSPPPPSPTSNVSGASWAHAE